MIDPKKTYKTRDGREVRILMTDGGDWSFPVIAAFKDKDGRWWPLHLTSVGRLGAHESALDLIEVKPRIKREVWVNVHPGGVGNNYETRELADRMGGDERIACVKLVIDCEEGEGL